VGIILGSGLGSLVNEVEVDAAFPYAEIPYFAPPTVEGHKGQLVLGKLEGVPIAILQGRIHFYEGHSMEKVVHGTRTLAMLGIEKLIISNSAGGLDPQMNPGDFMLIEDHINLMGDNPLKGPNLSQLGPRFPDMTQAYDRDLSSQLADVMDRLKVHYKRGIYCGVSGPTYETPAEVRYLQMMGGTAVGMSTVPEVIAANHLGLRVCALSCITNLAAGLSQKPLSHNEVTEKAREVEQTFCAIVRELVGSIDRN
jgi:purine-nucleoside phosphorylase